MQKKSKKKKTVLFYVTDEVQQSQYINLFKEQGIDAVILKHNIDSLSSHIWSVRMTPSNSSVSMQMSMQI